MTQPVVVIGLDCLTPQLAFEQYADAMPTLHRLAREGAHGRLRSVTPPITVPAWACSVTGKTPGALGVYGLRNRRDFSYQPLGITTSLDVRAPTIWDRLGKTGKSSIVVGVPPGYPPKPLQGHAISCFLTPGTDSSFTYPDSLKSEIEATVGEYWFDVPNFRHAERRGLLDDIHRLTEQRFRLATHLMTTKPWEFLMTVDMGPDRLHHAFWQHADPEHVLYERGNPFQHAMRDYYRFLDDQLTQFLERVPDDAAVLIVSDHGAQRMDGGIAINEWLIQNGYLALQRHPDEPASLDQLEIDWGKTSAWGEGGYYGRIFLNVQGREPQGTVPANEVEALRHELITKLEALGDEQGQPIGTRVHRPEELYEEINGIPPDLIALFGDLHWRSVGSVGHGSIWTRQNDTGPDGANHAPDGVLVAVNVPGLQGELAAPRLTELAGTALDRLEPGISHGLGSFGPSS